MQFVPTPVRNVFLNEQQTGVIEWFSDDVCRFNFFRNVLIERKVSQRTSSETSSDKVTNGTVHTRKTTVEHDWERTHRHVRHTHDVVEAQKLAFLGRWSKVEETRKPFWVEDLIDDIPEYLRAVAHIVTGQQIYEQIVEEDLKTEEWTEVETSTSSWFEESPEARAARIAREAAERQRLRAGMSLYRWDPAVVVGHYVLAGWSEKDLA